MIDWQTWIALLITGTAALVGARYQWRQWQSATQQGGCAGCHRCPAHQNASAQPKTVSLVQLQPVSSTPSPTSGGAIGHALSTEPRRG